MSVPVYQRIVDLLEAEGIAAALGGAEGREGIAAFLEKRKPDFGSVK